MNDVLLAKTIALKNAIEKDERILLLNELNKKLENDEDAMRLAQRKDEATILYEDTLKHYAPESAEAAAAQKHLYEAKLALDNNIVVKEYNSAYKQVWLMYAAINRDLFAIFANKKKEHQHA